MLTCSPFSVLVTYIRLRTNLALCTQLGKTIAGWLSHLIMTSFVCPFVRHNDVPVYMYTPWQPMRMRWISSQWNIWTVCHPCCSTRWFTDATVDHWPACNNELVVSDFLICVHWSAIFYDHVCLAISFVIELMIETNNSQSSPDMQMLITKWLQCVMLVCDVLINVSTTCNLMQWTIGDPWSSTLSYGCRWRPTDKEPCKTFPKMTPANPCLKDILTLQH